MNIRFNPEAIELAKIARDAADPKARALACILLHDMLSHGGILIENKAPAVEYVWRNGARVKVAR